MRCSWAKNGRRPANPRPANPRGEDGHDWRRPRAGGSARRDELAAERERRVHDLHLGVDSAKLRLIYVKAKIGRSRVTQAHMVLGYYDSPSSDPLVLDSLVSNVLPGSQRTDLIPVFSFNDSGIWQPGQKTQVSSSTSRLSRWRDVIERMKKEGISRRS